MTRRLIALLTMIAMVSYCSLGCQPAAQQGKAPVKEQGHDHDHDHDHGGSNEHKHPETLSQGIAELVQIYTTVKTAMEGGKPDDAHDPLHAVGHLLQDDLPGLVEKSELDADAKAKVSAALKTLFDQFHKLDGSFHEGEKVDFAELDKIMGPAVSELKGLTP